ncbi:14665_t:CDS:1, partial [Ambispora leptoticha]
MSEAEIRLPAETVNKAKSFIRRTGEQHGEAVAVRKYARKKADGQVTVSYEKHDMILLPSHYSYDRLLAAYNLMNPETLIKSRWTFRQLWRADSELTKIVIRKPSKDKCDECTVFKRALKENVSDINEDLDAQLMAHITDYREMRDAYENDIHVAKTCDRSSFRIFSFDFAQNLELPHDPQQPGKWYYLSLLKAHQFGLVDEGIDSHWHVIYTEGKALKGANEVASIIHLFLTSTAGDAKKIRLWADNCGGQNKNTCLLWYFLWACHTQIFQEIEYRFQIKGHTRNSVDRGFGLTKREYTRSEVWCIDQLLDVIDRSANNNIPINLEDQIGPFRDWTSALSTLYRRPPAIQKYHIFQFSHERPGIMRAKVRIDDPWDEFQLLKRNVNVIALNPQELQPKGLPEEKQVELWEKIRPYCPVAFRDELCPKPQNDLFER